MRLILATSHDGFLARGLDDDMSWTTPTDKKVFRLLTQVGGVCGVGYASRRLMPGLLQGRKLVSITRDGRRVSNYHPGPPTEHSASNVVPAWAAMEASVTLGRFWHAHHDAWLLGGPRLAVEAIDLGMVNQVFMCRVPVKLGHGMPDFITPRLQQASAGVSWELSQSIVVDEVTVDCWSRKAWQASATARRPSGTG
jgi:dihydrofolate reductase